MHGADSIRALSVGMHVLHENGARRLVLREIADLVPDMLAIVVDQLRLNELDLEEDRIFDRGEIPIMEIEDYTKQ